MADHWTSAKHRYDVAVFNGEYGYKARGGRIVNIFHGTALGYLCATRTLLPIRSLLARGLLSGVPQWLAGLRHTRVAVSDSAAHDLRRFYGLTGISVIPNGVDIELFAAGSKSESRTELGIPPHARVYLYASRVEPGKCPLFLQAWANALLPDEHLLVATDKPVTVTGRLTTMVNVPREQMPRLFRAADVFLMPSYYEGCSYAVIEAMACECMLVASPVGHAQSIIREQPILKECFEPERSATAFLGRARGLLDQSALAAHIRVAGREYVVKHNTLERMGEAYGNLFLRLLLDGNRTVGKPAAYPITPTQHAESNTLS
jgi:glycosyltransferase involved in cell wall biosynthesis